MADPEPAAKIYAVRLTPRADQDAIEAAERLSELAGDDEAGQTGRNWYRGFQAQIGTLGTQPHRYALLPDESKKIGLPTRRMPYRSGASGKLVYHVYFTIEEESPDGPLRHAARKPLTAKEGREIRQRI